MISITDKKNCCGCTACYSICPTSAIKMQEDSEGFLYPSADSAKCISCGLCFSVCEFKERKVSENVIPKAYAVQHLSSEVLAESASGGAFTALSDFVISKGGAVYGVAFDENFKVVHIKAENFKQRDKMRGSKYVQSDLGETFKKVKSDLQNNTTVLFVGTPVRLMDLNLFCRKIMIIFCVVI